MDERCEGKRLAIFGSFEFDCEALELKKCGTRLRLEDKPAKALACMLTNAGNVVARGDLIKLLWPGESHGDFNQRLNKAVNKLRLLLGDDPLEPRFIQTLSRHGYRFIGEVEFVQGGENGRLQPTLLHQNLGAELADDCGNIPKVASTALNSGILGDATDGYADSATPPITIPVLQSFISWTRAHRVLVSCVAILLTGIFLSLGRLGRTQASRTEASQPQARKAIAVLALTNLSRNSGDDWLGAALAIWITSDLAKDGQVYMVSTKAIARLQSELAMQPDHHLGQDGLARLRKNLGPDLVVSGSFATLGTGEASTLRLDLQIQDTNSGKILHTTSITGRKSDTFELASNAGAQLRQALNLDKLPPEEPETVREMLPRNPEAERFYTEGIAHLEKSDAANAQALLNQAVEIEPQHALSHFALSQAYSELGYSEQARSEAKKAVALSIHLPAAYKLLVEGQFRETSFEWDKAIEVYRSLMVLFPDNVEYGLRLARAEISAGKASMAFETVRHLRQVTLSASTGVELDLAESEAAASISDFRRQQDTAARASAASRKSDDSLLVARAEMLQGEAQRALGSFPEALRLWSDATQRFEALGDRSSIARVLVDEGKLRWQQGDFSQAEQSYNQAIAISKEMGDKGEEGRALAGLGQMKMYQVSSERGRELCEEALAIFRRIGNQQEEAYALSLVADAIAWHHGEAKALYEKSLELSRKVNDRSRTAGRLMDLGIMATVQGDLATAERDLQESLHIYHEIGERNREALQMSSLAIVFKWQGRLGDAQKLAQEAIEILLGVGETNVRGQVRQNLAIIQMEAGKLAEAEQSIRLAIQEHHEANDLGSVGLGNANLAAILAAEGKWAESKVALDELGKVAHWNIMPSENATAAIFTQARLYAAEGQFSAALREAHRGCEQTQRLDQGSLHMKARLVLGEIELQSGNQPTGRRQLEQLSSDASAGGFGLISDQARHALSTQSPQMRAANAARR